MAFWIVGVPSFVRLIRYNLNFERLLLNMVEAKQSQPRPGRLFSSVVYLSALWLQPRVSRLCRFYRLPIPCLEAPLLLGMIEEKKFHIIDLKMEGGFEDLLHPLFAQQLPALLKEKRPGAFQSRIMFKGIQTSQLQCGLEPSSPSLSGALWFM